MHLLNYNTELTCNFNNYLHLLFIDTIEFYNYSLIVKYFKYIKN